MKKNILVVDDSALMRRVICDIINSSAEFEVKDTCKDGQEAYEKLKANHYDAMLLDVNMPRMNGLELLQKMQKENIRVTVVVISSLTQKDASISVQALEAGAVEVVSKPENIIEAKGLRFRQEIERILNEVFLAQGRIKSSVSARTSAVRQSASTLTPATPSVPTPSSPARRHAVSGSGGKKLIALACSTGGPRALQSVIPFLESNMDAPLVLVQHMPKGFTKSMAERLDELSKVSVKEAEDGEVLQKGHVYVAPGGFHLEIAPMPDGNHKVHLSDAPAIGGLKPCADVMYKSLRRSTYDKITCVVLTGMGADGTEGIKALARSKSIYVIAQDEPTCVVYGMPRAIAEAGLTDEVVPLTNISKRIINQVGVR